MAAAQPGSTSDLPVLPETTFRNDSYFRLLQPDSGPGLIGCGLLCRPAADVLPLLRSPAQGFCLIYLLRGGGHAVDDQGNRLPLVPGVALQSGPGRSWTVHPSDDGQWCEAFLVLPAGLVEQLGHAAGIDGSAMLLGPGLHLMLVQRFQELLALLRTAPPRLWPRVLLRAQRLLLEVHRRHGQQQLPTGQRKIIDRACLLLGSDLAQRLSMEKLAGTLALDYRSFRQLFQQRMGVSPGQYRIRLRIAQACGLLSQQRCTVAAAAKDLGYPDAFSLSKQFRKVMGQSPAQYLGRRGGRQQQNPAGT